MDYILAILMGIAQGLTEFIPVSSTAHLRIIPELFHKKDAGAAFTAVIQIGTLLSLLVYFRKDILTLTKGFFISLLKKDFKNPDFLISSYIIIGTIPIVIFGILLKRLIEHQFRSMTVIGSSLIIFAILLIASEIAGKKEKDINSLSVKDAVLIGLAQALALIPGASRSGVTICMALFLGYKRESAARYSFLLSIPSVLGAGLFELKEVIKGGNNFDQISVIISTVASFISGLIAIEFLLRFLVNHRVNIFAYYRIALGAIILIFFT
jgi:undecaprenyl-diphosphatase